MRSFRLARGPGNGKRPLFLAIALALTALATAGPATAGSASSGEEGKKDEYERLLLVPLGADPAVVRLASDIKLLCGEVTHESRGRLPSAKEEPDAGRATHTLTQKGRSDDAEWGNAITALVVACRALHTDGVLGFAEHETVWDAFRDLDAATRASWIADVQHVVRQPAPKSNETPTWKRVRAERTAPAAAGVVHSFGAAFGGLGGSQAAIVEGLASFLAERAELELTMWLEDRLAGLCTKELTGLGTVKDVAPNLCEAFGEDDSGLSPIGMGRALRAAAIADLRRLPDRLLWHAQQKAKSEGGRGPLLARVAYAYASAVYDGGNPLEMLAGLAELPKTVCDRTGGAWDSCNEAAGRLRALGEVVRCALPLIDLEGGGAKPKVEDWAAVVLALAKRATVRVEDFGEHPFGKNLQARWERAMDVFQSLAEMYELVRALEYDLQAEELDEAAILRRWGRLAALGLRIVGRQGGVELTERDRRLLDVVARVGLKIVDRDFAGALTTVGSELMRHVSEKKLPQSARTLLSLGAELASAESSEEVAKALEAAAAPPGGYREKFRRHMVSLTGFVGVAGFWDWGVSEVRQLDGLSDDSEYAFYPVGMLGVESSFALHEDVRLGLYLSLLDVGALLRARVGDAATGEGTVVEGDAAVAVEAEAQAMNDVGLTQVFAPGLFFTLGICELPLTLGVGASYSPELRAVSLTRSSDDSEYDARTIDAIRFGFFLAVDVTILPF